MANPTQKKRRSDPLYKWVFDNTEDLKNLHLKRPLTEDDLYLQALSRKDGRVFILSSVDQTGGVCWSEVSIRAGLPGLRGDRGPTGWAGMLGDTGPRGGAGDLGPLGDYGPRGDVGDYGEMGPKGDPGDPGPRGPRGAAGERGEKGEDGPVGHRGRPGHRGNDGPRGPSGELGLPGIPGSRGESGQEGSPGPRGPQGHKGEKGEAGLRGQPGIRGQEGPPGDAGPEGEIGEQGLTGDLGPLGKKGPRGPDGYQDKDFTKAYVSSDSSINEARCSDTLLLETSGHVTLSSSRAAIVRSSNEVVVDKASLGSLALGSSQRIGALAASQDLALSGQSSRRIDARSHAEAMGVVSFSTSTELKMNIQSNMNHFVVSSAKNAQITTDGSRQDLRGITDRHIDQFMLEGTHLAYGPKTVSLGTAPKGRGEVHGSLHARGTGIGEHIYMRAEPRVGQALSLTEIGWVYASSEEDIDAIVVAELAVVSRLEDNANTLISYMGRVRVVVTEEVLPGQYLDLEGRVSPRPTPIVALEAGGPSQGKGQTYLWALLKRQ